jgi:hypothetical protein
MSMAGMRAGLQQMRAQLRTQSANMRQILRQHSTKAAAATGGGGILAFAQSNPFAFQVAVSTAKTGAADLMTQTCVDGKSLSQVDVKRNLVFIVFGAVYLGGFQWWIQVTQFRKWFPGMDRFANASMAEKLKDTQGMISAVKQICFDVFVHLPFMYFPAFYATKEFCQGTSWNPIDWVRDGCTKYYNNFAKDTWAMLCLWGPADCILFSLPMWLRMPARHVVSFGWTAYVSFLRGAKISAVEDKKQ